MANPLIKLITRRVAKRDYSKRKEPKEKGVSLEYYNNIVMYTHPSHYRFYIPVIFLK